MIQAVHPVQYSFPEYVAFERTSNVKHEYLDGQIYAMAGGTPEHAALAVAVSSALHVQLRGKGCVVYSSDLRVKVQSTGLVTYPDVTVVCGPPEVDAADATTVVNPTLVVEVTSPSTEAYDRGEKREHYLQIPSLREMLIVSHAEPVIEVWRRDGTAWVRVEARLGERAVLASVGCEIDVTEVYAEIDVGRRREGAAPR
jgi:Uma2 family endonuclease